MKKTKATRLILEFTEFNLQRFNPETAIYPLPNVANKELSVDAWDRHQSAIQSSLVRLNNIMGGLSNTSQISSLRSQVALENQNLQSLTILRVVKKGYNYDVYVKFVINDVEYWGVIYGLLDKNPVFESEVFVDTTLLQPKEWKIKTSGLIIKSVRKFFEPEFGTYKLVNNYCEAFSRETGQKLVLEKGSLVNLVAWDKDKLVIEYNLKTYDLRGDNFIYFNWWFEKKS